MAFQSAAQSQTFTHLHLLLNGTFDGQATDDFWDLPPYLKSIPTLFEFSPTVLFSYQITSVHNYLDRNEQLVCC
jgi:hypothetical protein